MYFDLIFKVTLTQYPIYLGDRALKLEPQQTSQLKAGQYLFAPQAKHQEVDSQAFTLQSRFFNGNIVATYGWREDTAKTWEINNANVFEEEQRRPALDHFLRRVSLSYSRPVVMEPAASPTSSISGGMCNRFESQVRRLLQDDNALQRLCVEIADFESINSIHWVEKDSSEMASAFREFLTRRSSESEDGCSEVLSSRIQYSL